jgi:hypothetical protein
MRNSMSKATFVALALLACFPGAANAGADNVIIVQVEGKSAHDRKPPVLGWLALIESDVTHLAPTRIHRVHIRDKAITDFYDLDLWASNHPNATFLLRHNSLFKGPIQRVELPLSPLISDYTGSRMLSIKFGNSVYRFDAKRLDAKDPGQRQVTVTANGATSLLYDWRTSHSTADNFEIIQWAGDLDRDGRMDFIVGFETYGGRNTCLFLSGQAKPPQIAKRVGCSYSGA